MSENYINKAVTLIGIGDDGCAGLTGRAMNALMKSQILAGGERHLTFFPDFSGKKIQIKGHLNGFLEEIRDLAHENTISILSSGDPLFFGIGSRLIESLGRDHVEVIPHPGAMQFAFARIGIKWDDAEWITLHGRKNTSFIASIRKKSKVIFFTDEIMNPSEIAKKMIDYGETEWNAWLCENLSGPGEKISEFSNISELAGIQNVSPLNVLVIQRKNETWKQPPEITIYDEELYAKRMPSKGLITKKEVRILSIASLRLNKNSVVWDIGAGSGSVGIECALVCDRGEVFAVEMNSESIQHLKENARTFGADNLTVVHGRAPEILPDIDQNPDAVFIGGSNGSLSSIISECYGRLSSGGTMVVNAITMENIHEANEAFRNLNVNPEITMLNVSRVVPVSKYMRYEAQNPIHIFCVQKKNKEKQ